MGRGYCTRFQSGTIIILLAAVHRNIQSYKSEYSK